jgi:uncharacterized surface protein with fasciclin (FAS1) repeats
MEASKINTAVWKYTVRLGLVLVLVFLNIRCNDEVIEWKPKTSQLVITDYVYSEPELFSEFGEALRLTGIENLLRVRGPFTLLLPTNEAMEEYYTRMGVTSCSEIDAKMLEDMVYNHIFEGEITTGAIGLGTLPYENALGDFVASDFIGTDILLNKIAIIVKRDIQAANGYVQHIDHVLEPITISVYEVLADYPGYSIFLAGLDRAGLADTLRVITFPYGNTSARARFTLLAVPDTLYNRMGIFTIDDLIALYSTGGDLTDMSNGFYQYIEYHCLSGTHYFSDFTPNDIYYMISYENYLNIRVEEDYKINKTAEGYTGFYYELSNIPAKNGAIHTVNTMLPNEETALATVTFQTTDYFDLQQGPYYQNYYQSFYDGQNTFEYIKWDGEFLQYYLKTGHNLMDDDCLKMDGHFWIEITTPKIRKGKYNLLGHFFQGGGRAVMSCYLDGEYYGIVDPNPAAWGAEPFSWGDVNFAVSKPHIIRLESLVPGQMFWDYIRFVPIQ